MNFSEEILNTALAMSMEFGENWLKPIHERINKKYPNISSEDLDKLNSICKKVNQFANNYVYRGGSVINGEIKFVDYNQFKNDILLKYNWISEDNLSHLYSQSCYYARK
ncbi:hypothetical protein [Epilithonimonas sp.]|uniref:hypothetical protein n=1 Tax=Epilithonimonas sp. TaxID=2894511 RepID=UPI0028ACDC9C|nr:hypothetical protein [Epilithonimonas sp.]